MGLKRVTVQLVLDVEDEANAADAVNEILREQQRDFTDNSCLIDYVVGNYAETDIDLDGYVEGDACDDFALKPLGLGV